MKDEIRMLGFLGQKFLHELELVVSCKFNGLDRTGGVDRHCQGMANGPELQSTGKTGEIKQFIRPCREFPHSFWNLKIALSIRGPESRHLCAAEVKCNLLHL